jgi:hypothetical protein
MRRAYFFLVSITVLAGICFGQTASKKTYKLGRTPYGQPDLQGYWATATITPLERPAEFADKPFLTEQEAKEYERKTVAEANTDRRYTDHVADLRGNYNEFWRDRGTTLADGRRTSLIFDPPDGKVPPLTEAAIKRRQATAYRGQPRGPEDLHFRIRCITRGLPMTPTPNNNFFQIVETKDYVLILQEMMYELRIIPLDGRPHAPQTVRGYMGDPRGHWEGETLVIDSTNFSAASDFMGSHEGLHLVERLTRTAQDTIDYQFTVDDPSTFTRQWSAALPMKKTNDPIYDYECHEGNYTMFGILGGARLAEEKEAEEAAKKRTK